MDKSKQISEQYLEDIKLKANYAGEFDDCDLDSLRILDELFVIEDLESSNAQSMIEKHSSTVELACCIRAISLFTKSWKPFYYFILYTWKRFSLDTFKLICDGLTFYHGKGLNYYDKTGEDFEIWSLKSLCATIEHSLPEALEYLLKLAPEGFKESCNNCFVCPKSCQTTTAMFAAGQAEERILELILDGTSYEFLAATNSFGGTALCCAVASNFITNARMLLNAVPEEKRNEFKAIPDDEGEIVLHRAVSNGNYKIVELLLKDTPPSYREIPDNHGRTSLLRAIEFKHYDLVPLLLKGSNPEYWNMARLEPETVAIEDRLTPFKLATKRKSARTVAELVRYMSYFDLIEHTEGILGVVGRHLPVELYYHVFLKLIRTRGWGDILRHFIGKKFVMNGLKKCLAKLMSDTCGELLFAMNINPIIDEGIGGVEALSLDENRFWSPDNLVLSVIRWIDQPVHTQESQETIVVNISS